MAKQPITMPAFAAPAPWRSSSMPATKGTSPSTMMPSQTSVPMTKKAIGRAKMAR